MIYNLKVFSNALRFKVLLFIALMAYVNAFQLVSAGDTRELAEEYNEVCDNFRAMKDMHASKIRSAPESMRSVTGKSSLIIGGELFTDYLGSVYNGNGVSDTRYTGGWFIHNTNLRFGFQLNDDLRASIKFDLSDCDYRPQNRVLEEALVIWDAVCGGPLGLFFGVGEVPYGQDRTLGIIQSYNHTEGNDSSEGPVILSSPYFRENNRDNVVYHPGEIDRVVMAGVSYTWNDIIKAEFAFYMPNGYNDEIGIYDRVTNASETGFESFAGRIWWNTPIDGLVAEVSGVRKRVPQRGDNGVFGSNATEVEYAVSVGFDWNVNEQLEVFAEYQHGFDWGFIEGRNTDTVSVGSLYSLTDKITLGAMAEWLHISDRSMTMDLNKFVLHTQYKFANGVYIIAEYGAELYNWDGALTNMFAFRSGVSF